MFHLHKSIILCGSCVSMNVRYYSYCTWRNAQIKANGVTVFFGKIVNDGEDVTDASVQSDMYVVVVFKDVIDTYSSDIKKKLTALRYKLAWTTPGVIKHVTVKQASKNNVSNFDLGLCKICSNMSWIGQFTID